MLDWLLSPIRPDDIHLVQGAVAWHGRLMVLGFGIFMPLGILVARFFKILPTQDYPNELRNTFWWYGHLALQWSGTACGAAAMILILQSAVKAGQSDLHVTMGYLSLALVLFQVSGGILKGSKGGPLFPNPDGTLHGDHYNMTPRRVLFERLHKSFGYLALIAIIVTVMSGLWAANAPVWIWMLLSSWWFGLVCAFVLLQRSGFAFDTYRAIWGPDMALPGNKRKPIGFGIRIDAPFDGCPPKWFQKRHRGMSQPERDQDYR